MAVTFDPSNAGTKEGQLILSSANINSEFFLITLKGNALPILTSSGAVLPSACLGVGVSGNYAYFSRSATGLQVYDVSNPAAPSSVATLGSFTNPQQIFISGNTAYVAAYGDGLKIVNISDPLNPTVLGTYSGPTMARHVTVLNNRAFLIDETMGLQILDVSNPASPALLGSLAATNTATGIAANGNYVYFLDVDSMNNKSVLKVINVTTPASPVLAGSCSTLYSANALIYSENKIYVAEGPYGVSIFDVTTPSAPSFLSNVKGNNMSQGLVLKNGYLYSGSMGLTIIDAANKYAPAIVSSTSTIQLLPEPCRTETVMSL